MFAGIIFAEKIWSKGIWIARGTGIVFVIIGVLSMTGIISISTEDVMDDPQNKMNNMMMMMQGSNQDRDNINRDMNGNMNMNMT